MRKGQTQFVASQRIVNRLGAGIRHNRCMCIHDCIQDYACRDSRNSSSGMRDGDDRGGGGAEVASLQLCRSRPRDDIRLILQFICAFTRNVIFLFFFFAGAQNPVAPRYGRNLSKPTEITLRCGQEGRKGGI